MLICIHGQQLRVVDLNGEVKAEFGLGFEPRLLRADGPTEVASTKSSFESAGMKTGFFLTNEDGLLFEFALEISEAVPSPPNKSLDLAPGSSEKPRVAGELQYQIVQVSKEPLAVTAPGQVKRPITDGFFSASHDAYVVALNDGSVNMVNRWSRKLHRVRVSEWPVRLLREEDREASLFFLSNRD